MRKPLGPLSEFSDGAITIREVDGTSVGIFRHGHEVHALLNVCPHRGAEVCKGVVTGTMLPSDPGEFTFGLDGLVLRCPWHGWEYHLRTGESIGPVDRRSLTMFEVTVENDHVLCDVSQRTL